MSEPQESWHLDKRVPISIIFTILMQLACFVWFASQMSYQVEANRANIEQLTTSVDSVRSDSVAQAIQLGRIEEILKNTSSSISRVERLLDEQRKN
jgi:hypothetical protein